MKTSLELECFDGTYSFRLPMSGIAVLESKCDAGLGEIYARTLAGRYGVDSQSIGIPLEARYRYGELVEVIRQGLIGGGSGMSDGAAVKVDAVKANALIAAYVSADKDNPVARAWELAAAIMFACVEGYDPPEVEAQPVKKKRGASTGVK